MRLEGDSASEIKLPLEVAWLLFFLKKEAMRVGSEDALPPSASDDTLPEEAFLLMQTAVATTRDGAAAGFDFTSCTALAGRGDEWIASMYRPDTRMGGTAEGAAELTPTGFFSWARPAAGYVFGSTRDATTTVGGDDDEYDSLDAVAWHVMSGAVSARTARRPQNRKWVSRQCPLAQQQHRRRMIGGIHGKQTFTSGKLCHGHSSGGVNGG